MKKLGGFSLMEMMIVLLITAVVAAATAPLVSKKMIADAGSDSPWFWIGTDKSIIYNMSGANTQTAYIGGKLSDEQTKMARLCILQNDGNPQLALKHSGKAAVYLYSNGGTLSFSTNSTNASSNATNFGASSVARANASAFGYSANASGANSVAVGYGAQAAGSNSIAIGYGAQASATDSIAIGRVSVESGESNTIRIGQQNDTVWIGGVKFSQGTGTLGDGSSVSDRRLKTVGEAFKGGLEEIKKLDVFNYVFKNDPKNTPRVGVMAQDLEKIFPNAVTKGSDGYLMIRMEDMFYAMINAIKELDFNIFNSNKRITELENKNKELEARIAALEKKSFKADKKSCSQEVKQKNPKAEKVKQEKPKVDEPKPEKAKIDGPKPEKVKAEKVKSGKVKAEKPKAEEPKVEKPKEQSVKEAPKIEKPEIKTDAAEQKPVKTEIKAKKHTDVEEVKVELDDEND